MTSRVSPRRSSFRIVMTGCLSGHSERFRDGLKLAWCASRKPPRLGEPDPPQSAEFPRADLPKTPLADAIGYTKNQWGALSRFLDDARLKLDNNAAERSLRRVAVGRKNWMFAGSAQGAERAAVLWTLLASCKLHGLDPFAYVRDVLSRVGSHPARDVLALSPKAWKQQLQDAQAR